MSEYRPATRVPLPPPDSKVYTTACDYCIVGCGFKVYVWPDGLEGGHKKDENALGVDFPFDSRATWVGPDLDRRTLRERLATGKGPTWVSPNQHNYTLVNGRKHHVVVIPDPDATVVNRLGNHSIRGGTLAGKVYNPDGPTSDRLTSPLLRVRGTLTPISWDAAAGIMARVSRHVIDKYGEAAWGMKTYSYGFFENTYAISKLAFGSIRTPAYAPHDKPGPGSDTAGLDDSGIIDFSASYEDWGQAEVIFFSGTDPFETKTVLFTEWMMEGAKKLIFVLPRRTTGVSWAEQNGGLFLQLIPGTDTVLHLAIARHILENGWEDSEFVSKWVANSWEIDAGMGRGTRNTPWQWRTTWGQLGTDFKGYRDWLFKQEHATLDNAAAITGVPAELIKRAAEMLARPVDGRRPKPSFALEKGNYWSNNYLNTASFAALGLLCGAGNRPGQVISRLGGHQRGWVGAASYPIAKAPQKLPGRRRQEIDLDRWVEAGNLRFAWVIGTLWVQTMAASQELGRRFLEMTRGNPHQVESARLSVNFDDAVEALVRRVDSGGMVVVDSDVYLRGPIGTEIADIVLPAATWGEADFTRCNGERRLRLYSKFTDPPGIAKPDWWAIATFARKMGFRGYDWADSNAVFDEAARFSRGTVLDYYPLVESAHEAGKRGHGMLREYGTTGIQCPVRTEGGRLVGTKRLHDSTLQLGPPEGDTVHAKWLTQFDTHSGKAVLNKSPWEWFSDFYARITPRGDELWLTNGRINEVWQSAYDDVRKPYIAQRWPDNFVEIHPADAASRGIESGDEVLLENDDVLIQTGGFTLVKGDEFLYSKLQENGLIRVGRGEARAVALVTDAVRPGVMFTYFMWPSSAANSLVHRVPDPITNRYRFKLGKARVRRLGESPYKHSFDKATLKPRVL
jgi:arsenite oxidase large subunit